MWMQQSMEHGAFGNSHERNRFSSDGSRFQGAGSGSYMGGGPTNTNNGDWKSKILESGQWLGGKVIEYGGKLARGGSHDSIPDHMSHLPRNDGRANWMADIRNSTSSFSNNSSSYSGGGASTYQNDFVTERPKAYTDAAFSSQSQSYTSKPPQAPFRDRTNSDKSDRRGTKDSKHSKKGKKKHSKRRAVSESEESASSASESPSEAESESNASSSEAVDKRRKSKTKTKSKSKQSKKHSKRRESISSSDEDTLEAKPKAKKTTSKLEKAPADYSFSFDPAKLPPPPPEESSSKKTKKDKKKSRGRRQSMESSASELSDKENQRTKTITLKSKSAKKKGKTQDQVVDLLGVDLMEAAPIQPVAPAFAPNQTRSSQPDIFSQPLDPLQDLAGLNFNAAYAQPSQPPQPVALGAAPPADDVNQQRTASAHAAQTQVLKKLLPENDIVDLNFLASEKKANTSVAGAEKKTLGELQREKLTEQQQQYQQQYQQAMLMQQQQHQQQGMMMGMQPQLAQAMMMQQQQQQAMQMQMQMGQMTGMMQQVQLQQQPSMYAAAQTQGYPHQPNQKSNGIQQFPFAQ